MRAAERRAQRALPIDRASLFERLGALYANFDKAAHLITIAQSTPQGRAMRMSVKERRAKAFRAAAAKATRGLPSEDATLAVAVPQLLHGGQAWIEMRQQWGLAGEQIARACAWAIRTPARRSPCSQGTATGRADWRALKEPIEPKKRKIELSRISQSCNAI